MSPNILIEVTPDNEGGVTYKVFFTDTAIAVTDVIISLQQLQHILAKKVAKACSAKSFDLANIDQANALTLKQIGYEHV